MNISELKAIVISYEFLRKTFYESCRTRRSRHLALQYVAYQQAISRQSESKRPHIAACITGKVRTCTLPLHHKTNTLYYIEQKNVTRNGTLKSTKKP